MPDKQLFPFWNYLLKPIRIFNKMLTMHDIMEYAKSENFKYLVIEASHGDYYGFNIKVKKERAYAMKIVSPDEHDNFMVVGWKVSKKLPKWVHNADSWIDFINGKEVDEKEVVETHEVNKGAGEDKEEEEEDEEERKQEEEEAEEVEEEEEDKEEEEEEEDEEKEGEDKDKEEEDDKEGQEGEKDEKDDDEDEDLDKALRDTADPLPYHGGEAWQGDPVDGKGTSNQKKSAHKKTNKKKVNKTLSYDLFEKQ